LWVNSGAGETIWVQGEVTEGTNFLVQKCNSNGVYKNLRGAMYGLLATLLLLSMSYFGGGGDFC